MGIVGAGIEISEIRWKNSFSYKNRVVSLFLY